MRTCGSMAADVPGEVVVFGGGHTAHLKIIHRRGTEFLRSRGWQKQESKKQALNGFDRVFADGAVAFGNDAGTT